ncbi:carboxymuconolactone decarboxylase family protein [Microbacterium salsuginis]|uniref:carboxymuconolactone decarboxylase family protein n=1 Tax=Microbacterium salsuginis TaxID=2722803 RepID=UPI00197BCD92
MTTQCDARLKGHARAAVEHGASEEELAEATCITAALRAGGGIVHGMKALGAVQRTTST